MKSLFKLISIQLLFLTCCYCQGSNYRILHHFTGGANDGSAPLGSLIQSGSTLYGMTTAGGSSSGGTIFRMNTDGTAFQLMHSFNSSGADGSKPYGTLVQVGAMLYGMAGSENNTTYKGALFRIGLDGSAYYVVHTFAGPPNDGKWPYDSIIESDSVLYGMTVCGGNGDQSANGGVWGGTVFRVNIGGTGYQILHHFRGGSSEGTWSPGNLVQSGSILYGMTFGGGSSGLGTIFRINTDGTDFGLLHSFAGGSNDGESSHSSLIQSGSILYGLTIAGGTSNLGIIFRVNTDGTGFQRLHSFAGGAHDGSGPVAGSLVQSGSILYGMTYGGGASNNGVVFQMNNDGTDFQILHSFTGENGAKPFGVPFLSDSTLYGMTSAGGSQNLGVIFALDLRGMTSVHEENNSCKIENFELNQNYPNPFNPSTVIGYHLPAAGNVKLSIYNLLGQKIKTLVDSFQSAGEHSLVWDATDEMSNPVSSGIYFYRIEAGAMNLQKKMILIK